MKTIYLQFLAMALLAVNIAFAADEIHWTVTGKDSVTFNWRGRSAENSIGYGLSSGNYTQATAAKPNPVPVSSKGPFWEAKLTGLKENTRYYYKIGNMPERSFRTGPAPGSSDFNVYAQGNMGSTSTYFEMGGVQDIIAGDLPAFVVGLGDLTLGNTDGRAAVDQHFNDIMQWSTQAAYMPVWGEKDTTASNIDNFKNYKGRFAVPNSQTSPGSPLAGGEDWYWFDYGNVRFITLPEPWTGAWDDWHTKAGTLMAEAQGDPAIKFIVTFVHRPAYSSGHNAGSPALKDKLDALGDTYSKYQLNVNAHSNNYERSFPQHGVTHVTAGTGGADLDQDGDCLWLTCTKPSWSAFRAMHLGALKLHFTDSGIEGSFICGPAGGGINDVTCSKGSVLDSFAIGKLKISAVSAYDITRTDAKITWALTEPSTGQIEYGTTTAYGQMSKLEPSFKYTTHIQQLSGLSPDTLYHFRVHSTNQAGVESVSGDFTFSTTTPLTVSLAQSNVKCNGALTGSATVSVIGGKAPYTYSWSGGGTNATKDGLAAGTYTATVTDASGSTKTGSVTITQPPEMTVSMSQVDVSSLGGNNGSATVTAGGGNAPYSYLWSGGGTSATKGGLTAGTYTVTVSDANSCEKTGSVTITQPAAAAGPTISAVSAYDITQTEAKITWTLNEGSTGQVEYGTTTAYGQISALEPSFIYTTHIQQLSGLAPGTLHHFRIHSRNQAGVESVSGDFTFTTEGTSIVTPVIPIITGPIISAVSAYDITQTEAKITWTLNEGSTGQVEYGTTTAYGQMSALEPSFIYTTHIQQLSGLAPGTLYHFRVYSTNAAEVESVSGDFTFTTAGTSTVDPVIPVITGPTISAVSALNITQSNADITWSLSEPATGQVEYGTTTSYGKMSTKESSFKYSSHTQKISGLTPGAKYHYRVRSANQAGKETISGDYTLTTATTTTTPPTNTPPPPTSGYHAPPPTSSLVVNVRDKGAKGNGSTNDTAAIQAAVNQVGGTGGTVYVPNGTYMIDAETSVNLKSNMTLKMESGAVLKAIPNNGWNYDILKAQNASNLNVVGGTIKGERNEHLTPGNIASETPKNAQCPSNVYCYGQWGYGIRIIGGSNIYIENVLSRDCWGDGFIVTGNASNVNFYSVVADNNRRQGLSIIWADGIVIRDSIFKNTKGHAPQAGIDIEPMGDIQKVDHVQILDSKMTNNWGAGLLVERNGGRNSTNHVTVRNCIVTGNRWGISWLNPGVGSSFEGCTVTGNSIVNIEYTPSK